MATAEGYYVAGHLVARAWTDDRVAGVGIRTTLTAGGGIPTLVDDRIGGELLAEVRRRDRELGEPKARTGRAVAAADTTGTEVYAVRHVARSAGVGLKALSAPRPRSR